MIYLDPSSVVDEYLRLEQHASEPYNSFVYDSADQACDIARFCLDNNVGETSAPYGRAISDGTTTIAMISFLDGEQLRSARTMAALCLVRANKIDADGAVRERMWLASQTLFAVRDDDLYLSRIAVAEPAQGRGAARKAMALYEQSARDAHKRRLVLEVSPRHQRACQLYQRCGFVVTDKLSAEHLESNRSLAYLHMVKTLD